MVSCGAPGAGGVNRAWAPEFGGFPPSVAPDPSSYQLLDQCPSGLIAQSAPPPGNAPFLTSGSWVFSAPSGTRITRLETWRFGGRLRTNSGDPDGRDGDQGDTWETFARDENASVIGGVFGETCQTVQNDPARPGCSFGTDTGVSATSRAVYPVNVGRIAYSVSCEDLGGCPRYFDNGTDRFSIAWIKLFGTRVTVTDPSAPTFRPSGSLLAEGWRRPSDVVVYDASDNVGIRAARLELAGRTEVDARACDFRRTVPCSSVQGGRLGVPAGTPDGEHAARLIGEDAAGNETVVPRTIKLDGTPPVAVLERASGRTIVISVSDAASGVANATLEVRDAGNQPYRTLPATIANGRLTARLDRGRASKIDMKVTVDDVAGNQTSGNPARLSVTSARIGRRNARVRSARVRVPCGRRATLRGRLTLSAGQAFGGQSVALTAAPRKRGGRAAFVGSATTDGRGRFSIALPAGPSRNLRFVFPGAPGVLGIARGVSARVPASSSIRASRTRLSGAGRVRFSGTLRRSGQRIPGRGLVLVLQGREGGKWRTFADTRTDRQGRWRASYRFSGRRGSYPIRARIRKQANFPFELGYSGALTVRVG